MRRSLGRRLPETERPRGYGKRAGTEALGGGPGQATESSAGRVQCSGPLCKGTGEAREAFCRTLRAGEEDTPGQGLFKEALAETR